MAYLEKEANKLHRAGEEMRGSIDYSVSEQVRRGFYAYGFDSPTTLQRKGIATIKSDRYGPFHTHSRTHSHSRPPCTCRNRDVLVLGGSGTGKTVAYVLPLLDSIQPDIQSPQACVLVSNH
jgi:superfamily II DNA/RNA helicase